GAWPARGPSRSGSRRPGRGRRRGTWRGSDGGPRPGPRPRRQWRSWWLQFGRVSCWRAPSATGLPTTFPAREGRRKAPARACAAMSPTVPPARRVLATLLFTDVVGSTERAAALGDERWHALLARHDASLRRAVDAHGGRLVNQFGDGALALMPGPSDAVGAVEALRADVAAAGLEVRAGVHAGECLLAGGDVRGLAVHVA